MREIHFYSDAPEWGGHEILSARIANILAETKSFKVNFLYSNQQFETALSPDICKIALPFTSSQPLPLFRDWTFPRIGKIKQILKEKKASILVVCQGNIERCLVGILAAKKLGIPVVSYIPFAYTQKETGAKLAWLRDKFASLIYPKIDHWVTISDTQERLLRRFIPAGRLVHQVPIPLTWGNPVGARKPCKSLKLATVGRLYFPQKGQDFIPPLAQEMQRRGISTHFTVIGSGPNQLHFERMLLHYKVTDLVTYHPWVSQEEIRLKFLEQFDALLIPSLYEGGPTVLFEALECGIPVIIADAEYAKDYSFPPWMVYRSHNIQDAADKIARFPDSWNEMEFENVRHRVFATRTESAFKEIVTNTFTQILNP